MGQIFQNLPSLFRFSKGRGTRSKPPGTPCDRSVYASLLDNHTTDQSDVSNAAKDHLADDTASNIKIYPTTIKHQSKSSVTAPAVIRGYFGDVPQALNRPVSAALMRKRLSKLDAILLTRLLATLKKWQVAGVSPKQETIVIKAVDLLVPGNKSCIEARVSLTIQFIEAELLRRTGEASKMSSGLNPAQPVFSETA